MLQSFNPSKTTSSFESNDYSIFKVLISALTTCQQNMAGVAKAEPNTGHSHHLFVIMKSMEFGRYLEAAVDIPQGTTVLEEPSVVYSPSDECLDNDTTSTVIFCLSCSHNLYDLERCSACRWPLCDNCNKTADATIHHDYECSIFQRYKPKFPPPNNFPVLYKSVLILRMLLLIRKSTNLWNDFFSQLEHHNEERNRKPRCVETRNLIIENIQYFMKEDKSWDFENSKNMLEILIGIVNVNSFASSRRDSKSGSTRKARSLFETGSFFAHSCAPNCWWNISYISDENFKPEIRVVASIPIKKGDLLTIPYNTLHLFYGTLKRQIVIESMAHFVCCCKRCLDPTEFGSYISSIRCFKCENGWLISSNTADQDSPWVCSEECCNALETVEKVVDFTTDVEEYFDKIRNAGLSLVKEAELLQKLFIKHHGKLLHENHYSLQEISTRIVELLVESLDSVGQTYVNIFLWHCHYLKKIADNILPGLNGYQDQLQAYTSEGIFHQLQLQHTSG